MNKKISIEIAVGIITLIALAFGGFMIFEAKKVEAPAIESANHISNEDCVGEGKASYSETSEERSCCPGLKTISKIDADGNRFYDVALCTKCGDGICKDPENKFNCSKDCKQTGSGDANLANPSSVYCEQNGGKLEIQTAADGGQVGICKFTDGSECEEWAYMRGDCKSTLNPNIPKMTHEICEAQGAMWFCGDQDVDPGIEPKFECVCDCGNGINILENTTQSCK